MRNRRSVIFLGATLLLLAIAWIGRSILMEEPESYLGESAGLARVSPAFTPPEELIRLILVFEQRITEVTTPSDYVILASLYLESARATGDLSRYGAARDLFEQAAKLRPEDLAGRVGMARSDFSLHRFAQAQSIITQVLADVPDRVDARALLGDIQVAIGDIDGARESFRVVSATTGDDPALDVRLSNLAWLEGDHAGALALAEQALDAGSGRGPAVMAWYESFAAQMAFQTGAGERALELAMSAFDHDPASFLSKASLARMIASRDVDRAIELYREATDAIPEPEYLAALADLYTVRGETVEAARLYDTVTAIGDLARAQGTLYDRQVALFYADHQVNVTRAAEMARAEVELRQDPESYDTLAWALYRVGDLDGARTASDSARQGGFRSADLLFHSGMISQASGDNQRALAELEEAMALNPDFDPLLSRAAGAALDALNGADG